MTGIYSLNTAEKLFEKLVRDFSSFCNSPSEEGIFNLIFPLYHLREWIYPPGYEVYKNQDPSQLTIEQKLHSHLHSMDEYEIIRALCNNAKHFNDPSISERTERLEGKRCGLGRCGDAFDITHFLVDGIEIRDIFWPVYLVYFNYFKRSNKIKQNES